ncbi:N-acyl-phosphatidylethanolamine-hydrolyzing phospholipase D [Trichinella pseudospiralis]|uniref:N-acyl-phosphatidylethanolamine-hydrolyzing phospholipase D n=2 Tax=Trichinella pseudospiralis TaxID=6337 RepID=A0A0V1JMC5_TRIPS|nr:N-acyl-phosphatidylethanolamine-hydrolyzing phospholipase D [Trichinella pseudospiralis]
MTPILLGKSTNVTFSSSLKFGCIIFDAVAYSWQKTLVFKSFTMRDIKKWSPLVRAGRFQIPWKSEASLPGIFAFIRWKLGSKHVRCFCYAEHNLETIVPEFNNGSRFEGLHATWLGHASLLVKMKGGVFLTDPVLNEHRSWFGIKRIMPISFSISDLPKINAVLISHNHYDHLDAATVGALNERFGDSLTWFVPMGLREWFLQSQCKNVHQLTWWEEMQFKTEEEEEEESFTVVCLPAQHWNIGNVFGPFDLAAIPIGCYEPRWFMKFQHVDPAEAVQIHLDVKARQSLGIHWGTFHMGAYEIVNILMTSKEAEIYPCNECARVFRSEFEKQRHILSCHTGTHIWTGMRPIYPSILRSNYRFIFECELKNRILPEFFEEIEKAIDEHVLAGKIIAKNILKYIDVFNRAITALYVNLKKYESGEFELNWRNIVEEFKKYYHSLNSDKFEQLFEVLYRVWFWIYFSNQASKFSSCEDHQRTSCQVCLEDTANCVCQEFRSKIIEANNFLIALDFRIPELSLLCLRIAQGMVRDKIVIVVRRLEEYEFRGLQNIFSYLRKVVFGWLYVVMGRKAEDPFAADIDLCSFLLRCEGNLQMATFEIYGRILISMVFRLIETFPTSYQIWMDLRYCMQRTGQSLDGDFINEVKKFVKLRILAQNTTTTRILILYVKLYRALHIVFIPDSLATGIFHNIQAFLKSRCNLLSRAIELFRRPRLMKYLGQDLCFSPETFPDESTNELENKFKYPVESLMDRPGIFPATGKNFVTARMLIDVSGSQQDFFNEYRKILSAKLIKKFARACPFEYHILKSIDSPANSDHLYQCQMMIRDVVNSKRFETFYSEKMIRDDMKLMPVHCIIASANSWPEFSKESLVLPDSIGEYFSKISEYFKLWKRSRILHLLPNLGSVQLHLGLNGCEMLYIVEPCCACIILQFTNKIEISIAELCEKLKAPYKEIERSLNFWLQAGVLGSKKNASWYLRSSSDWVAQACIGRRPCEEIGIEDELTTSEEDAEDSVNEYILSLEEYWPTIRGWFQRFDSLTPDRAYLMLKILVRQKEMLTVDIVKRYFQMKLEQVMNDQKFDSEIALLCSINLTVGILVIIINTIPFSVLLVMKKFNSEISLVFASVTIQMIDGVQFLIRGVRCHTINKWSYVPLVFVGECLMTNFEIHLRMFYHFARVCTMTLITVNCIILFFMPRVHQKLEKCNFFQISILILTILSVLYSLVICLYVWMNEGNVGKVLQFCYYEQVVPKNYRRLAFHQFQKRFSDSNEKISEYKKRIATVCRLAVFISVETSLRIYPKTSFSFMLKESINLTIPNILYWSSNILTSIYSVIYCFINPCIKNFFKKF